MPDNIFANTEQKYQFYFLIKKVNLKMYYSLMQQKKELKLKMKTRNKRLFSQ